MPKKTAGVFELAQDVLATLPEPYGRDIVEEVCLAIERNPYWRGRYDELADDLRDWVVNNWIGLYTKQLTGFRSMRKVVAKRSKIVTAYTQLVP